MRGLTTVIAIGLAAMILLSGCHPREKERRHDREPTVPSGGADFGVLDHFHHAFAERSISNRDDLDGYEFALARSSVVLITVTGTGNLNAFIDLYDGNFQFIGGDDFGGPGNDPLLLAQLGPGDYFAVVGSLDGSVGAYAIDISVEPLGGSDLGILLVPDSVIDLGGSISGPFDVDSYFFTVYDNCLTDIFLTRTSGNYDGNLQLLDEYGNELAFIDPVGDNDPAILNQPLTPGTYIIRVGANSGSGSYTIQVDTF
jgi:hypothetical protein